MKFSPVTTFKVLGETWEIGYGYAGSHKGVENDGICNYRMKRITIQSPRRGRVRNLAEVVVHELAHARFRDFMEDAVEEFGKIIAEVYPAMVEAEKRRTRFPDEVH